MGPPPDLRRLASLLVPAGAPLPVEPPAPEVVTRWVEDRIRALRLRRPDPAAEGPEEDPRWLVWWLLRMAAATYRHLSRPPQPVDPALLARFRALVTGRPSADEQHAQLHVDAASTLRRAMAVRDRLPSPAGPVLAVGDDDAVTVALALLGVHDLHAIDVDARVLDLLRHAGQALGAPIGTTVVDVYDDPLPVPLRRRCAAVITDPPRSFDGALPFLLHALAALRREPPGRVFWADHPDWNFEHEALLRALEQAGLRCEEVLPSLHLYPLDPAAFPKLEASASAVGADPAWLAALARHVRAVSHLVVAAP
ncbi:MAG: bis-aminopropyl spermidine synthase family protein [Myxococcota bacterium]